MAPAAGEGGGGLNLKMSLLQQSHLEVGFCQNQVLPKKVPNVAADGGEKQVELPLLGGAQL